MSIGKRIKAERERQDMKAGDLAMRAALTLDKLSKIEHDKRRVSGTELFRIASALGVEADQFLVDRPRVMYRGDPSRPRVEEARRIFEQFVDNCLTAERLAWIHADDN